MLKKSDGLMAVVFLLACSAAQGQTSPNVSQVLMYSGTAKSGIGIPAGMVPSIFTETGAPAFISDFAAGAAAGGDPARLNAFVNVVGNPHNFAISQDLVDLNNALNASIATALSIIPLSSPASGIINRKDPVTGAELPVNSTLGPIFTERAETIGKHKFYIGFSNQDFHFSKFNGQSLNALSVLYQGGDATKSQVLSAPGGTALPTVPATFNIGMDVRLSQNIAFLTYGVTDRFDVSVGLPVVHAAVAARTYNGLIYAGNGFGGPTCWCISTFTPGSPTLILPDVNETSQSKSGFGDVLVRLKGTVVAKPSVVVAVGGDVRLPSGDAKNYLGTGTESVKPFVAVSFYSKPLANGIVISPHFDAGWQFSGKSILGGPLDGTTLTLSTPQGSVPYLAAPFTTSKGYLPDVFSWAVGTEIALGRRNTLIADVLGNQIGWIHGIPNAVTRSIANQAFPTGPSGTAPATIGGPTVQPAVQQVTASGLIGAGNVSFGQYTGSFGYKIRIAGNLVANFNLLVRLDDNGLTSRVVPMYGLGYSF